MSEEAKLRIINMILSKDEEMHKLGISILIESRVKRKISKSQFKSVGKSLDRKMRLLLKHKLSSYEFDPRIDH